MYSTLAFGNSMRKLARVSNPRTRCQRCQPAPHGKPIYYLRLTLSLACRIAVSKRRVFFGDRSRLAVSRRDAPHSLCTCRAGDDRCRGLYHSRTRGQLERRAGLQRWKEAGQFPSFSRKMDRESDEKDEIKGLPRKRSDVQSMQFRNPNENPERKETPNHGSTKESGDQGPGETDR